MAIVNYDRCSYCGACVPVCPPDCITLHDATWQIAEDLCTGCRRCVLVCPTAALNMRTRVAA
ncbi:MAG: 4Fe-4S binding protein [Anaerolineae bacterium]|nr:MAG: 4Fe-4S binding protein [Anaerolineae bacterium]